MEVHVCRNLFIFFRVLRRVYDFFRSTCTRFYSVITITFRATLLHRNRLLRSLRTQPQCVKYIQNMEEYGIKQKSYKSKNKKYKIKIACPLSQYPFCHSTANLDIFK